MPKRGPMGGVRKKELVFCLSAGNCPIADTCLHNESLWHELPLSRQFKAFEPSPGCPQYLPEDKVVLTKELARMLRG